MPGAVSPDVTGDSLRVSLVDGSVHQLRMLVSTIHSKPGNRRRGPNAGYVELYNAIRWGRNDRLRELGPGRTRALVNVNALLALRG